MTTAIISDSFFKAMEAGTISWADLMEDSVSEVEYVAPVRKSTADEIATEVAWWSEEYKLSERVDDWEVPDLTLRSDITENFPVALIPLKEAEDGRERFMVKFDDRVDAWANERAESNAEYMEYADWVQTRLTFALKQYSYKYIVESIGGDGDDYILTFKMAHASAAARRGRAAIPTLSSFPITWEQDRMDHTRHIVKPHMKRLAEMGTDVATAGVLANEILDSLLECDDCTIEMPNSSGDSSCIFVVVIPSAPAPKRYVCECKLCERPAMGGAGGPSLPPSKPYVPLKASVPAPATIVTKRALDVMRTNRLAWERDGRKHFIKRRTPDQDARMIAELSKCSDCKVESTSKDSQYMCVVILL